MQVDFKRLQETGALSCLECGKCTGVCPVARYSSSFSPRSLLIKSLRNSSPEGLNSPDLWACLTCQQCDEICPSDISYIELTQLLRESSGGMKEEANCSHGGIFQTISRIMMNDTLKQDRTGWIPKELQISKDSEYLYFVGCLPYYEPIFREIGAQPLDIASSTLKILNYFDIRPQVLPNEKCCGHDFFWNGEINNFKKLANANLEQFQQSGIKKIITACPECYRTLKVDYPKFLGTVPYEVMHITELLAQYMTEKNIRLTPEPVSLTFQDPCRLGRHMGIYEPPREVLAHMNGITFKEMAHHHKRATCCGVSSWMNCSQVSKQIQKQRLNEAKATGASVLVTSCPKCQIHFSCALQDANIAGDQAIKVKDLTQIVAECLH